MTDFEKRIIIGGLPRAGTTLFRYILDASESIICGPETAFFTQPLSVQQKRGDRTVQRVDRALDIGPNPIARAIKSAKSSFEAFDAIMLEYCRKAGVQKLIWAEKTPRNCTMYHSLAIENPDAYFISLIRDGRDVLTSQMDGRNEYHCSIQRYVESLQFVFGFTSPRHLIVRYEDMVADPQRCFRQVFDFLEIAFTAQALERYRQATVTRDATKVNQPKVTGEVSTQWVGHWNQPEHRQRLAEIETDPRVSEWLMRSGYGNDHEMSHRPQRTTADTRSK